MADFNVRSDSIDVEQIMSQIRGRIRDKRGVDYTEEQIRQLAAVKFEKYIDPQSVRSDLLEQFRRARPSPLTVPLYPFEDTTLFDSHRGIVRFFRRLFRPFLKLIVNMNALARSLHAQTVINKQTVDRLDAAEARGDLYYELLHNLVVELTRTTIEVKNVKMRVESLASRLEFNERRARALESVVVYAPQEKDREEAAAPPPPKPTPPPVRSSGGSVAPIASPSPSAQPQAHNGTAAPPAEGPGQRSRRRRRRRGRRGGASAVSMMSAPGGPDDAGGEESSAAEIPGSSLEAEAAPDSHQAPIEEAHAAPPAASSAPAPQPATNLAPESHGAESSQASPRPAGGPASDSPDDDVQ